MTPLTTKFGDSLFCNFCSSCTFVATADCAEITVVAEGGKFEPGLGGTKNEYTVGSPRFMANAFNSTVGVTTTRKIRNITK